MIKGAIFDLDDTLYNYEEINHIAINKLGTYVCEKLGVTYNEFLKAFDYARDATKNGMSECASQHNRMLYCQKTLEYLNTSPTLYALEMYDIYWDTMLSLMKLNEGVFDILQILKCKEVKIGVCTDLTVHIQHRKIRKLGLTPYIDCLVTSEEVGAEKPNIKMFHLILAKMGLVAKDVIYVGDSFAKDIVGAYNAGIKPIWYNENSKDAPKENFKFYQISSFYELEMYIE